MKTLSEVVINTNTKVFVRADLDVPVKNGQILEKYRLDAMLPTLKYLQEKHTKIIIAGHMGKPHGKLAEELSTKQLLPYFNENLGVDTFNLLENLRFDIREEQNNTEYAHELAGMADVYVNESFSTSHEVHASIVSLPKLLPSYAGLRLLKEVENLKKVLVNPARPLVALIGGVKLDAKKPAAQKFIQTADMVLVGGKIGNNWNAPIPANMKIPKDYAEMGKDIGPKTIETYKQIIATAKTVIWSGPLGAYEEEKFALGTNEIAQAIIDSGAFSVIGGGDTVAALEKGGFITKFGFVSTGGSAMLAFLVNGNLPGLEALGYNG